MKMAVQMEEGVQNFEYKEKTRKLRTCVWSPSSSDIKALAFLCHGYGERLNPYYDQLGERGADQGVLVFGHDHTGHGLSEGERVQVESEEEYVRPVLEHCNKMKSEYPDKPLYIVGHSMGGLITVLAALEDDRKAVPIVDGIVLVGPLIQPDPEVATPFKMFLAKIFSKIWPSLTFGKIRRNSITTDKNWLEVIENDDKRWKGSFKALHSYILLTSMEKLKDDYQTVQVPMLILHGEKDMVCTLQGSKDLHQKAGSQDKTLKVVEDSFHNPLLEVENIRNQCISDIWSWILNRSEQSS